MNIRYPIYEGVYRILTVDIRRRKNDSRTYFFDRASEKLNERIVKDDERERARKR